MATHLVKHHTAKTTFAYLGHTRTCRVSETEILMEQQTPKEVFICDHAGFVILDLSNSA